MCRKCYIIFAAFVFAFSASAQIPVATQVQTNNPRPLALDEAIRLALEHNLEVQIEKFNPRIAEYTLRAAYEPYDPNFRV
ncbi:MAG: hypothetical protein ABJC04_11920, partial [Verrucomicrobiota bacterium]